MIFFGRTVSYTFTPLFRPLRRSGASDGVRVHPRPVSGADRSGLPAGLVCLQRLELPQLRHRGGGGATQVSQTPVSGCAVWNPCRWIAAILTVRSDRTRRERRHSREVVRVLRVPLASRCTNVGDMAEASEYSRGLGSLC